MGWSGSRCMKELKKSTKVKTRLIFSQGMTISFTAQASECQTGLCLGSRQGSRQGSAAAHPVMFPWRAAQSPRASRVESSESCQGSALQFFLHGFLWLFLWVEAGRMKVSVISHLPFAYLHLTLLTWSSWLLPFHHNTEFHSEQYNLKVRLPRTHFKSCPILQLNTSFLYLTMSIDT